MRYRVTIPCPVWITAVVDSDDKESAIDDALDVGTLGRYVGNGGNDKLIGVNDSNISIEAGEIPLESAGVSIEVEEA